MEWTYTIVKPFTINRHSLYGDRPYAYYEAPMRWQSSAELAFNEGEIDRVLYEALVKGYPEHVKRTPKNELVAAVYAARGLG